MRRHRYFISTMVLVVAAFALAYAATAFGDDTPDSANNAESDAVSQAITIDQQDKAKPRFSGQLLGVYIAPTGEALPLEYRRHCGMSEETSDMEAGELWLDFELPKPFVLAQDHMKSGVIACDGEVVTARWTFSILQGELTVTRIRRNYAVADISEDRVSVGEVGGRQAIILTPVRQAGAHPDTGSLMHSDGAVLFPESFGLTKVESIGVPFAETLRAAKLVAEATQ